MPSLPSSSPATQEDYWFRVLAETTSAATFVAGERFVFVNRALEELTGYSQEELLLRDLGSLVHADSQHALRQAMQSAAASGLSARRYELRLVRRDGGERCVDLTLAQLELDGETLLAGTAVDVSEHRKVEAALRDSEERLSLTQRAARSVTWEWHPETDRLTTSTFADTFFGFPVHDIVRTGEQFRSMVHPEDRERLTRALKRCLKGGEDLSIELRFVSPRGEVRWLAEKAVAVRRESGWVERLIGVAHEVTERKVAEDALFQEKERAHVTLAAIADGVIRTDARGAVDYLNPVAQKLTGWTLAEAYGRPSRDIYEIRDEETGNRVFDPVEHCLTEAREVVFLGDRLLAHRDGRESPVHDSAAPIRDRNGRVIGSILVFKDLSRLREIEQQMHHLATHDPLTGLINRREFETVLARGWEQDEGRHAICHLDLDNFKLVNDAGGQGTGDQVIRQIARVVQGRVREQDVVARLGADQFGVLLWNCDRADAEAIAQGIVEAVREFRFHWQDRIFSTGASIGLAAFTPASSETHAVLRAAVTACYLAKESGGNRVHVHQPGDSAVTERYGEMRWVSRLHKAFDEDRFVLYRQVIQPLDPDRVEAPLSELFVRLVRRDGRLVGPKAFITAAERFGVIPRIDEWVLRTALELLARAGEEDDLADTRFAVNVSGKSLSADGFLDLVVEQFERTGVAPERLHFEITETAAIADLPSAMRFISVLKERGCRFVLDDFGQGLSSFGYLKNLPLDYLKIDGEFVRNLLADPIQAALVASIHEIGDVMGLKTIAESIEDQETLEAVKRMGVDYAQGFYIAKPEPLVAARRPSPT